jgi:hypothetical protein
MARMGASLRRLRWLFWHPHHKLWNRSLVGLVTRLLGKSQLSQAAIVAVVWVDSVLLTGRVLLRRMRTTVTSHGVPPSYPRPPVLYIDCGVHKHGEQIRWMHRWFGDRYELHVLGFEASGEYFRDASAALADLARVRLHHVALVGPDHVGGEVRLHKAGGGGRGEDSLLAALGDEYEVVSARRLSDVLAEEGYALGEMPVILRMSIVGAERLVIEDLLDAGVHTYVDGYYGVWGALSNIDPDADRRFRQLLRRAGITKVTFNDRDLVTLDERPSSVGLRRLVLGLRRSAYKLRAYAIRTDLETSLRVGLARVNGGSPPTHS